MSTKKKQDKRMHVRIVQDPKKEEPVEVIAAAVIEISRAMNRLMHGRLKREAIVALIHDRSKLGKTQIEIVLNNLEALEDQWIRKRPQERK